MRVTEFWGQGGDVQGSVPAPRVPAIKTTRVNPLTSTPQKVCVLDTNTRLVRLFSSVNAVFEIIPDAESNITLSADGEYLVAGQDVYRAITAEQVRAGSVLAVWARTA